MPPPSPREPLDRLDVLDRMDAQDLIELRGGSLDQLEPVPVLAAEALLDRGDPGCVLGMRPGLVLERERVAEIEAHGPLP